MFEDSRVSLRSFNTMLEVLRLELSATNTWFVLPSFLVCARVQVRDDVEISRCESWAWFFCIYHPFLGDVQRQKTARENLKIML